jgi:MerR family transcriptional regulator, mercuric resistance operon regulatory protein
MSQTAELMIGELARISGLTPETIRYYERERVIPRARRDGSGKYRKYDHADADRLRFVRRARELGFSLDDVRELLALAESDPSNPCGDVEGIARAHIAAVNAKIAQLTALRHELTQLTSDCDPKAGVGACTLLSAMK